MAENGADDIPWNELIRFTVAYLRYLTLVNVQDLLHTYNLLSDLVQYVFPRDLAVRRLMENTENPVLNRYKNPEEQESKAY